MPDIIETEVQHIISSLNSQLNDLQKLIDNRPEFATELTREKMIRCAKQVALLEASLADLVFVNRSREATGDQITLRTRPKLVLINSGE